jgi:protein-S-isoprenylcysteine O-methyltransferase Ste14
MIGPMSDRPDNPGVRVPPPALYALAVFVGYLLNQRWPVPIGGGASVQALAWLLFGAWLVLTVSSIGNFRRSRTSIVPIRPATTLVIAGPYRFTRNPMYVGLVVLTVALGLFLDSWWLTVFAGPGAVCRARIRHRTRRAVSRTTFRRRLRCLYAARASLAVGSAFADQDRRTLMAYAEN